MLEDITSLPYRRLAQGLRNTFARNEPPLIFAGGHEHSLQVIEGVEPTDPTAQSRVRFRKQAERRGQ